uniref:Uncharacterized protein n=1 Tax=Micrurus carvalhoi TaxID=3147026 RepID=A0A2H6MZY4_9SAUR
MNPIRPITVMEDNESVVYISDNNTTGSRSRQIDIRYKNIKQLVKQAFIKLQYVPNHEQVADLLNKPLPTLNMNICARCALPDYRLPGKEGVVTVFIFCCQPGLEISSVSLELYQLVSNVL